MKYIDGQTFLKMLCAASEALEKEKETLNKLNVFPIPDGDTGNNMCLTLSSLKNVTSKTNHLGEMSKIVAKEMLLNSRGNSGTILASFFIGVSKAQADKEKISIDEMIAAFKVGAKNSYKMMLAPQEGTILTLMREAGNISLDNIDSFEDLFSNLTELSQDNLKKTPDLLPVLKQAGVVDSGSYGFVVIIKAMRDYLLHHEYESIEDEFVSSDFELTLTLNKSKQYEGENTLSYLEKQLSSYGEIKEFKEDNKVLKLVINSKDNNEVVSLLEKYGIISNYDVVSNSRNETKERKKVALVSVAVGDGIILAMEDLGFDVVINGENTLNVSYQTLKEGCDKANADVVFLFPNNKDTIPTATLLSKTETNYKVVVIETVSMMQAIYLITLFDGEESPEEIELKFSKSIKKISSIGITRSVKDTNVGNLSIHVDDYLVLLDSKIIANFKTFDETSEYLATLLAKYSVVSIYYGKNVEEQDAYDFNDRLSELFNYDTDVLCFYGGQNVYDYLILGE